MRPIHLVSLDKQRPALLLTREEVRPFRNRITVAPVTSTIRGLAGEVPVGPRNGLDHSSVVNCDDITTVDAADVGRLVGYLFPEQESVLAEAIAATFDLEP